MSRTSGATYQWNDNINENFQEGELPNIIHYSSVWKVIGQGQEPNLMRATNTG